MDFQGTHEHTLDAKNRLTIPSGERHKFEEGVVLVRGIEPCIEVWVPSAYEAFVARTLADRSRLLEETRQLARYFGGRSTRTALDTAGRVLLPPTLIERAGLGRDVTVICAAECLEVWDRATAEAMNEDLDQKFAEMAERLGQQG